MIRGFLKFIIKSIIDKGPVPLKTVVSMAYVSVMCVCVRGMTAERFRVMCPPLLGRFSGRKGRIWESGRNKMKGQSDQTSQTQATRTLVFLVSNSAI